MLNSNSIYICNYCGKECKNANSLRNHERMCNKNPNRDVPWNKDKKGYKLSVEPWNKGKRKRFIVERICPKCGKHFTISLTKGQYILFLKDPNNKKIKKFCSLKCSNSRIVDSKTKEKIRETFSKKYFEKTGFLTYKEKRKVCKICGQIKCKYPEICKSCFITQRSNNLKLLGFDFSKIGSIEIYDEYFKIQKLISDLYFLEKLSLPEIKKRFNIPSLKTLDLLVKFLKIKPRCLSDACRNAILKGRAEIRSSTKYKNGWHTTWNNKKVYYRSSYELDFMNELDNKKIDYDVEKIKIKYFDSNKKCFRIAIPDFYIPSENKLVEIKSDYTYDKINMRDKFLEYRKLGYDPHLILEHKEVGV